MTVNGEVFDVQDGATVRDVVISTGAHPGAVAVALNGEVVPRGRHAETVVRTNDRVEVIRAVGGG